VRDVAERSGVDEGGSAVGGLHEIRKNGFGEESHHATGGAEVACGDGYAIASDADDDGIETFAQSLRSFASAMMAIDFGRGRDDEASWRPLPSFLLSRRRRCGGVRGRSCRWCGAR